MLDKGKLNYLRFSIVQASELNEITEELKIERDKVMIASVDVINMYLSVKLLTIKKAVRFFAKKLTTETKKTINQRLDPYLGMSSTLISFNRKYYEYHGGEK